MKKIFFLFLIVIIAMVSLAGCRQAPRSRSVPRPNEIFNSDIESVDGVNLALYKVSAASSNLSTALSVADGYKDTFWIAAGKSNEYIEIDFDEEIDFNTITIREKGNYIKGFSIRRWQDSEWVEFYRQDRIEYYRYCAFETQRSNKIRIYFNSTSRDIRVSEIEVYNLPKRARDDRFMVTAYYDINDVSAVKDGINSGYLDVVTDIIFFLFVFWNREGELVFGSKDESNQFILSSNESYLSDAVSAMREAIGDRDVRLCINILNGTHMNVMTQEATVYSLTNHQDTLIDNIIDLVDRYEFDGVDFDWEYPATPSEWKLYGDFFVNLKSRLGERYLTVALSNFNVHFAPEHIAAIDYVQIMGYDRFDYEGNNSSFRSGAYAPLKFFLDLGFSHNQLISGLPYYGRPDDRSEVWTNYNSSNYAPFTYWDNYADYTDINGTHKSFFNGGAMVYDKTAFCVEQRFAGIMVFRLYLDLPYDDDRCLTKAIGAAINDRIEE